MDKNKNNFGKIKSVFYLILIAFYISKYIYVKCKIYSEKVIKPSNSNKAENVLKSAFRIIFISKAVLEK
jgi:hypothetical protein